MDWLTLTAQAFEIAGGVGTTVLSYLFWASGYAGYLWNLAKRNHYKSPPLDECTSLNLM